MRFIYLVLLAVAAMALALMPLLLLGQTNVTEVTIIHEHPPGSGSFLEILNAMIRQVVNRPASLLVIISLSIIAYVFETANWLPSKAILPICVFGGASIYWLFAGIGTVPHFFPYPHVVLFANGLICGLVAFILHKTLVEYLINRFKRKNPNTP